MRRRPVKPAEPPRPRISIPAWLRPSLVVLSCLILFGLFSKEISNTDFWWQLRTGQYVSQTRSLPDPDPFAYTTATAGYAYPGEAITRRFNLTHEWLAQVLLYLVYQTTGFGGIVLSRVGLLIAFCAMVGLITYRRCGGFYRSIAAAFAAGRSGRSLCRRPPVPGHLPPVGRQCGDHGIAEAALDLADASRDVDLGQLSRRIRPRMAGDGRLFGRGDLPSLAWTPAASGYAALRGMGRIGARIGIEPERLSHHPGAAELSQELDDIDSARMGAAPFMAA